MQGVLVDDEQPLLVLRHQVAGVHLEDLTHQPDLGKHLEVPAGPRGR